MGLLLLFVGVSFFAVGVFDTSFERVLFVPTVLFALLNAATRDELLFCLFDVTPEFFKATAFCLRSSSTFANFLFAGLVVVLFFLAFLDDLLLLVTLSFPFIVDFTDPTTGEWNSPTKGGRMPEPTRHGDWHHKGRCTDF